MSTRYGSFNDYDPPEKPSQRTKVTEMNAPTLAALAELESIHTWWQFVQVCEEQRYKRGWG